VLTAWLVSTAAECEHAVSNHRTVSVVNVSQNASQLLFLSYMLSLVYPHCVWPAAVVDLRPVLTGKFSVQ